MSENKDFEFKFIENYNIPRNEFYCSPEGFCRITELIDDYSAKVRVIDEKNKEIETLKKHERMILNYCKGNMDFMWASTIVSIILDCDFRDAKQKMDALREVENE